MASQDGTSYGDRCFVDQCRVDARIDGVETTDPAAGAFSLYWNIDDNLNAYAVYSATHETFEQVLAKLRELKGVASAKAYLIVSADKSHIIPYQKPENAAAA